MSRYRNSLTRWYGTDVHVFKRIILGILFVLILLALLVYSQWRSVAPKVSGIVEADEIRLGSRMGGRVQTVHVSEGQTVQPGQVLVTLEPYDLEQRLAEAAAHLAARRAELARLQAGFRVEEIAQAQARVDALAATLQKLVDGPRPEEIATARAHLTLAESQVERTQRTLERFRSLRSQGSASQEELDRAVEESKVFEAMRAARREEFQLLEKGTRAEDIAVARAELDQATQALRLATNGYRQEEIDQASAAVDAAAAALAAIQVQQGELMVKADVCGVVSALELRPGDLVPANGPVLSLLDMSRLWVRAYVPQSRSGLRLGQKLRVTVDGLPERDFTGELTYIAPQAEFTPRNVQTLEERSKQVFRIKLYFPPGQDELRPGMTADVWLDTATDSR